MFSGSHNGFARLHAVRPSEREQNPGQSPAPDGQGTAARLNMRVEDAARTKIRNSLAFQFSYFRAVARILNLQHKGNASLVKGNLSTNINIRYSSLSHLPPCVNAPSPAMNCTMQHYACPARLSLPSAPPQHCQTRFPSLGRTSSSPARARVECSLGLPAVQVHQVRPFELIFTIL